MPTMSKVLITEQTLKDLAAKIRGKTGKTDKLTPSKMIGEIDDIGGLDWSVLGYSGIPEWLQETYNNAIEVSKCTTTKEYNDKNLGAKSYHVLIFDVTYKDYVSTFNKDIIDIKKCIICYDKGSGVYWPNMFANKYNLEKVEKIELSNFKSIIGMFSGCTKLEEIIDIDIGDRCELIGGGNSSQGMFNGCSSLTTVPLFNTSSATDMGYMFNGCTSLTTVPLFNTSAVTNMSNMFNGCTSLTTVPLFNTTSVTSFYQMFSGCKNLVTAPSFSTKKSENFGGMFQNCVNLENVPIYDMSGMTHQNFRNMFSNCTKLTNESLDNILMSLISASNAQSGTGTDNKKLSYIGFTSTYYPVSKIEALPHYQDFLDAGWTIGY